MNRSPLALRRGDRVASGRRPRRNLDGTTTWGDIRIEVVDGFDDEAAALGHNARMTLRHGDETRVVIACRTSVADNQIAATGWSTLWTDPLPADDDVARRLVGAAASGRPGTRATLLWVGGEADCGMTYAHLVTDDVGDGDERLQPTPGFAYDDHAMVVQASGTLARRSLIAARLLTAQVQGGLVVQAIERHDVIMTDVSLHDAASALPRARYEPSRFRIANFAGRYEVDEHAERAWAASEPSEAMVLAWGAERLSISCLATSGIAFWRNDDPAAYAEASIPGPGLWHWHDVTMSCHADYEGHVDCDMEGRWKPASTADVERLLGPVECVDREIVEYTEEDDAARAVDRHIAAAVQSERRNARAEAEAARRRREIQDAALSPAGM